ncbi:MAG: putative deacylase [Bacteriovoracaceae bacterium]|jgi:predicted deacylase
MNKLERIDFPLKQQPNGDYLWLNLFRINSGKKGPHVHIQANVHGAELQGNLVIHELMDFFINTPFEGSITFIPFANPSAVNQKSGMYTQGRYNPVSGKNWNRNYFELLKDKRSEFNLEDFVTKNISEDEDDIKEKFKSVLFNICDELEKKTSSRAHQDEDGHFNLLLQKVASTADIVLDLHTGPIATRYIYTTDYQLESALNFKFPHYLVIPPEFDGAMDEASFMPWFNLSEEFKKQGRDLRGGFESYTIELGSEERISFDEAKLDSKRILNYLKTKNVHDQSIEDLPNLTIKTCLLKDYRSYYAPRGGLYEFCFSPGEAFKKGDVLAKSLNFKPVKGNETFSKAIEEVHAAEDGIVINHSTSASLAGGHPLYQVMENIQ